MKCNLPATRKQSEAREPEDGRTGTRPPAARPPFKAAATLARLLAGKPPGLLTIDCPFCVDGLLVVGIRRNHTACARCSCDLDVNERSIDLKTGANWLERSLPPES